jgi:uncharacterized integral membrane protein
MEGHAADTGTPEPAAAPLTESRGDRYRRRGQRAKLYTSAFTIVALLVCLVALVLANTRTVQLSWVFGDTKASLVWIVLVAAILGWLLGLATSIMFRRATRRPSK